MRIEDAIYDTVHEYGVPEIATRLCKSSHTVQHCANPNAATHHFAPRELVKIQAATGDFRIAHAMAEELAGVFIEPGNFDNVADDALLDLFTKLMARLGQYGGEFNEAWSDGRLTQREFETVRTAAYQVKQVLAELERRMECLIERRAVADVTKLVPGKRS